MSLIDTARDATAVRGLALDGAGKAVLTYYDGTNGDLLVGRFNGAAWDTGAVDSYGDVGAWSAVAVQSDGALLELHYDATAADLKAGTWNAGVVGALDGNPRGRAQAPAAFSGVVGSASSIQWTWIDSASDELGWRLYGSANSTGPFTVVAGTTALPATAGTGTQRLYTETGLTAGTTYYRYAAAVSSGGTVTSPMAALFPFNTTDTAAPTALDNQAGEVVWRRAAGALYNVDFQDTGGSALAKFQVKASTVPLGAGPDVAPYTDVVLNILADTYTADWALPSSVFNAMLDGATHYISVRAYDGAGNVGVSSDVFTVLKDTTPPAFGDNQNGDLTRRAAAGTLYDVDVRDPSSGLERFQYSVSTTASVPDGSVVGWTDVPLGASTTAFLSDWAVAFASLVGDAPNYVSVRAWDRAGSTAALTDAFFVLKDTGGPSVGVTAPASAFRSALTALSGTAADPGGVGGVSVAVQTAPPAGLWFDGAAFTAGGPFWLGAAGTATWTFAGVPAWTDGGSFRVVARATDTLGNLSVAYSTADFAFDVTVPTAGVAAPADGSTLSSLPNLSGAAGDRGAGLALLEVRVRRLSDGLYWSWPTEAWGASALSTSPAVAANWTLPVPEALRASLASGASYFVSVRAVDAAVPANSGSLAVGSTFTWTDATAPAAVTNLSALTGPSPGTLQLSWTAPGDDGALGNVLLGTYRIHYSTDPAAAFSTSAAQVAFSTSGVSPGLRQGRLVTGLTAGATYHVRVFLADDAGNWSSLSNGATAYAGNQPFNKILGHVMKVSSEGVTAVKIEAYDASEVRVSQTFTLADGSGTFTLENVPDGAFKVQASWTADDVTSSVWLDGVAVGSYDVDFMLEINYTLSTLTGTLASLSAQSAHPAGFLVRAAEGGFSDARVDLLRRGFPVAQVRPDPTGRWSIPNLLPGKYSVRAFNGLEYTDPQDVELGEGETREVVFVFDPLPEASVFAFPNPARSKTTFRFVSALPGLEAQVTVFDIAGTLVKEIPGSAFVAKAGGVYHADWDLTNEDGESVASGVYLFMVKVKGNNGQSGKVVKKLAVVR
ncbi:T9SS type A sorting domain-containing protein [bacterium]|nr:MAG: T9SS type A sorting domain-containing protein [bacterium]